MIFLRDPQIKVERSVDKLTIAYRPCLQLRLASLIGLFPLLLAIVGFLTLPPLGQIFAKDPGLTWLILGGYGCVGLLGLGATYMLLAAWISRFVITADRRGVSAKSAPIPMAKAVSISPDRLQQFFLSRVNRSPGYYADVSVLKDGVVAPLCSSIPSGIAAFEIVRELNAFYELPLQRVEGWNVSFDDVEQAEYSSDGAEVLSKRLEIDRGEDSLTIRAKLPAGFGRILVLLGLVIALYGLTPVGSYPNINTGQYIVGGVLLLTGLAVIAVGIYRVIGYSYFQALSECIFYGFSIKKPIATVMNNVENARLVAAIGHTNRKLYVIGQDGSAKGIPGSTMPGRIACEVARQLNHFFGFVEEEIATFESCVADTSLHVESKEVIVTKSVDEMTILIPLSQSSAWSMFIVASIFVAIAVGVSQAADMQLVLMLDFLIGLVVALCVSQGLYFLLSTVRLTATKQSLCVESIPGFAILRPQNLDIEEAAYFEARTTNAKSDNKAIFLCRTRSSDQLKYIWARPEKIAAIMALLNEFYGFDDARAREKTEQTVSGDTEAFQGKSFELERSKHELVASYNGSKLLALVAIVYGMMPAIFLIWVGWRNFPTMPALSFVALLLGLASLGVAVAGVLTLVNRTTLRANRYEIVVAFGDYAWKKPTKLSPSQVKEWISRGTPQNDSETWRGAVGYSDSTHDYVPLVTQLPSWALADYLKTQLEIFYANQPKGDPTDQS